MESIELKMREIDGHFPAIYARKVIEILREPEVSAEVLVGQPAEEVSQVLESLGYTIGSKKPMDGWILMKAVKARK